MNSLRTAAAKQQERSMLEAGNGRWRKPPLARSGRLKAVAGGHVPAGYMQVPRDIAYARAGTWGHEGVMSKIVVTPQGKSRGFKTYEAWVEGFRSGECVEAFAVKTLDSSHNRQG